MPPAGTSVDQTWPSYRIAASRCQPRSPFWRLRSRRRAECQSERLRTTSLSTSSWAPASPTGARSSPSRRAPPVGADIKKYEWDLNGDGSIDKNGISATWSYPAAGSVNVLLRVKAKGGGRGEVGPSVPVQAVPDGGVTPIPPVRLFTVAPTTPVVNQPVLFTSASSDVDGALTEQVWDLNGDGSYDNGGGVTALRTFADPGEVCHRAPGDRRSGLFAFGSQTVTVLLRQRAAMSRRKKSGPRLLSPFPVVRIAGRITKRGTRVRLLRVSAPGGHTGLGPLRRPQLPFQPTGA